MNQTDKTTHGVMYTFRMRPDIKRRLKIAAARRTTTMASIIHDCVEEWLRTHGEEDVPA